MKGVQRGGRYLPTLVVAAIVVAAIASSATYANHECLPPVGMTAQESVVDDARCSPTHDPLLPSHEVGLDSGGDRDGTNEGVAPVVPFDEIRACTDLQCLTQKGHPNSYHKWDEKKFLGQYGVYYGPKHSYDLNSTHYLGDGVAYVCSTLEGWYSGKAYSRDCGNDNATANFPGDNEDTMIRNVHCNCGRHGHTIDMHGYY